MSRLEIQIGPDRSVQGDSQLVFSHIRVQKTLNLPTVCEVVFQLGKSPRFSTAMAIGDLLTIRNLQDRPDGCDLFRGEITNLEVLYSHDEGSQLVVRAADALWKMQVTQSLAQYVQLSLTDLCDRLLSDAGLPVRSDSRLGTAVPHWSWLIQQGESHLDFLRGQCESAGVYFHLVEDELQLFRLSDRSLLQECHVESDLIELSLELNRHFADRDVRCVGWSAADVLTRQAAIPAPADSNAPGEGISLAGEFTESTEQATWRAQAEADWRSARHLMLNAVLPGNPRLQPGTAFRVQGVPAMVDRQVLLTGVTHLIDREHHFTTEITSEPPPRATSPSEVRIVPGRVVSVNDPLSRGRVKVSLPGYDDLQTDWVQILMPGAGARKGILALPAVHDTVMLLCAGQGLSHAVVLGGVLGAQEIDPSARTDGASSRFSIATPTGGAIILDEGRDSLLVQDRHGSRLEFQKNRVDLQTQGNLHIQASGGKITFTAASIDFQKG